MLKPYRLCEIQEIGTDFTVTKLSWTKAKGHKYIAVGYTNGLIALFDLTINPETCDDQTEIVYPINVISAHESSVTGNYAIIFRLCISFNICRTNIITFK